MLEKNQKILTYSILMLALWALTSALIYTKSILVPFVISIFLYLAVTPILAWLEGKLKVPRFLSIVITIGGVATFLLIMGNLLSHSLTSFINGADVYKARLISSVGELKEFAEGFGYTIDARLIEKELHNLPIFDFLKKFSGGVFNVIGNLVLVLVFFLFLISGEKVKERSELASSIQTKISKYLVTKFTVSAVTATLVTLILFGFKVELALMFSILVFFFNFIPNIGSLIATILPLPIVFLQYGLGVQFFVILGLMGGVQFLIGNIIEPKFMGESMDLHPVTVLIFLMFWGLVWGLPGMFMAVPITAVLKIIFARFEVTSVFSEVMAGRFNSLK